MNEPVIVSAARLAVGRLGGALKNSDESTMGATVIREALSRAGLRPSDVDEVIMSQNYRSGKISSNSSRVMAIRAGVPIEVPEYTVNKHCGGGIKSVALAAQSIRAGDSSVVVAGGVELMSATAYLVPDVRWGGGVGHHMLQDQLVMLDPISGLTMGQTADKLAEVYRISREEQDLFAEGSQRKAERAIREERFKDEIVRIQVPDPKGPTRSFDTDEHPRFGTTAETLARLRPAFKEGGTVTAGNSSGMNDGAAALVVMSEARAREMGICPMARVVAYASTGVDPSIMGIGPVPATRLALEKAGLRIEDIDLIELNEAFAVMCIHFLRETGADSERLNVNGGAIALGHPIGATGAIILTKLLYELQRRRGRYGLATMCIGGGQGIAMIVERWAA